MNVTDKGIGAERQTYIRETQTPRVQKKPAQANATQQKADRVSLSPGSRELQTALAATATTPAEPAATENRTDRIAKLKDQVQNGSYAVDAGRIAQSMIESHTGIFG